MSYYAPLSYWEKDAYLGKYDVAIIGGGIVGMNAALHLRRNASQLKIVIIERASIGTAASSRNAGFACYGSPSEILSDLSEMSSDEVYDLVRRRVKGLYSLRSIVGDHHMKYQRLGGYEIFLDKDSYQYHLDHMTSLNDALTDIDKDLVYSRAKVPDSFNYVVGMLSNNWEGQLHPGYMTQRLRFLCQKEGVVILNNLSVNSIEYGKDQTLICDQGEILSNKVICCTNGFTSKLTDEIDTEPGRNIVLVTSPISNLDIKGCYHYDRGYIYFRNVNNRVLIGGGRNQDSLTERTDTFGSNVIIKKYLVKFLQSHLLHDKSWNIDFEWSGILGFNKTKKPVIKAVEKGIFVASGLGGMGVAIGTLVGQEVANLLLQS